MALLGRALSTRPIIKGIPPAEAPGPPPPTAPVGGMLGITSGGRHGRGMPARPLVQVSPRPLFVAGVTYNDSGQAIFTITLSGSDSLAFTGQGTATSSVTPSGTDSLTFTGSGLAALALIPSGSDTYTLGGDGVVVVTILPSGTESYQTGVAPVIVTDTRLAIAHHVARQINLAHGIVVVLASTGRLKGPAAVTFTVSNRISSTSQSARTATVDHRPATRLTTTLTVLTRAVSSGN